MTFIEATTEAVLEVTIIEAAPPLCTAAEGGDCRLLFVFSLLVTSKLLVFWSFAEIFVFCWSDEPEITNRGKLINVAECRLIGRLWFQKEMTKGLYPFQLTSLAWNCWVTELSCWVAFTQHMDQYWGSAYIIGYTSIVSRVPRTGIFERHCWTCFILGHYDTSVCVIVDHAIVVVPVD